MSEKAIPDPVAAFLDAYIDSVLQLELLLSLHARPERLWTSAEVGKELRIDPSWAKEQLANLCARGLVQCEDGPDPRYRFDTGNAELRQTVADLAETYTRRRVTVISRIFSKPLERIRSFADAFRIRKDKDTPHG